MPMTVSDSISTPAYKGDGAVLKQETSATARRIIALVVAIAASAVMGVAMWLTPSPTGMGTHQALNLPPCGWILMADMPCPTCGMTTAFSHAVRGHLVASFLAQPLGCLLALATAMALLVSVHTVLTGSRLPNALARLWGRRVAWTLCAFVVLAWGYKVASYKGWL